LNDTYRTQQREWQPEVIGLPESRRLAGFGQTLPVDAAESIIIV
jgi:hypothetical protein